MKKKFSLALLLILMSTSSWGAQIGNYPLKSAVSNNDTAVIVDAADANKLKRTPFVASNIPVLDTANYYLGADVEDALAEIGADLDDAVVLNFDVNYFSLVEGNVTIQPEVFEPADPTILKVAEIDTQAEFESLLFPFPSGGTGGYVATPWTYSNSACTAGQYALDTGFRYDCVASGNITKTALTVWDAPSTTYALTFSAVSDSTYVIDGVTRTAAGSPYTISGLNGAVAITATYGGTDDMITFSGTSGADVTGSYPNYSINMDAAKSVVATGSVSGGVLFDMDFEGTQAEDLAGGWTIDQPAGVVNLDYTPAISGTQSLYMRNNSGGYNSIWSPVFTSQSTLYYAFPWVSTPAGSAAHGIAFYSSGVLQGRTVMEAGAYSPQHGSVTGDTVITAVSGTTYYNCGKFVVDTNGTGVHNLNVGASTDPSLNTTVSIANGTATGLVDQIRLLQYGSNALTLDDFILSTEPIAICTGAGL